MGMDRRSSDHQTRITDQSFIAADLSSALRVSDEAEARMIRAVQAARIEHWSWQRIGRVAGVTGETARRRWATLVSMQVLRR